MSGVLDSYTVMQQTEWAGRNFYTVGDAKGQVHYLIAEPAEAPPCAYRHPALPHMQPLTVEDGTRWVIGQVPQGQVLEDLLHRGQLTEKDVVGALMGVIDALSLLSSCDPPLVPAYLDPSCIKKDWVGRWILDFLALAHAPETKSSTAKPLGVYPFGALLYWLLTGQSAKMTRIQITKIPAGTSAALQFILIRCLGRSYTSLAELRADVERAGRESEFVALVRSLSREEMQAGRAARPMPATGPAEPVIPGVPRPLIPAGGPSIPVDDRPWALPPKPPEGFRKQYMPPPPDPVKEQRARWGFYVASGLATLALMAAAGVKTGLLPAPAFLRPAPLVKAYPNVGTAGGAVGTEVPAEPPGLAEALPAEPAQAGSPPGGGQPDGPGRPDVDGAAGSAEPSPEPSQAPAPPPPPPPTAAPPAKPGQQPPAVGQSRQPEPAVPTAPTAAAPTGPSRPLPGTPDYQDAVTGAMPILVHVNGKPLRYAYLFPHPVNPYISLETFNSLFGAHILWMPNDRSIRLLAGPKAILTPDYLVIQGRMWLKLSPALQEWAGVTVSAYSDGGLWFSVTGEV